MSFKVAQIVPNGTYRIRSALKADRYLEFVSDGQWDVRPIVSKPQADSQKWKITGSKTDVNSYTITNVASNLHLSFQQGTDKEGKAIWRVKAFADASQWTIEPRAGDQFVIGFVSNEQCVDYADSAGDDWTILWSRNGRANQRWVLEPLEPLAVDPPPPVTIPPPVVPPPVTVPPPAQVPAIFASLNGALVYFDNMTYGSALDLYFGKKENGTMVIGYNNHHHHDNHKWQLTQLGGDAARPIWAIMNYKSKTYLHVNNGEVVCWASQYNNPNQQWNLLPAPGGGDVFTLHNIGTGLNVELNVDPKSTNNTPVSGRPGPGEGALNNPQQQWKLTRV